MTWIPPGKNCGACGVDNCDTFAIAVEKGVKNAGECPYYVSQESRGIFATCDSCNAETAYTGDDIIGAPYDFIITAFPGEPSARKIVLPFRPDLVETLDIITGDIITGRPVSAGCPVQHVIRVLDADPVSSLITGHVVGPAFARGNSDIIDLKHYHMIGFEGVANVVRKTPKFGMRMPFLPGVCMMHRTHTGVINTVMQKSYGLHVRVEGIVIL